MWGWPDADGNGCGAGRLGSVDGLYAVQFVSRWIRLSDELVDDLVVMHWTLELRLFRLIEGAPPTFGSCRASASRVTALQGSLEVSAALATYRDAQAKARSGPCAAISTSMVLSASPRNQPVHIEIFIGTKLSNSTSSFN